MNEKILYFDCLAGISGDMTVGALLDLGVEFDYLKNELSKLNIDGYNLESFKTQKNGITGTKFNVLLEHHHHHHDGHNHGEHHHHEHRNLSDIESIIDNSSLNDNIKELSKEMFLEVAKAEAKVHDKELNEIHFHEVGAIDSIIDIVGVAICIDKLAVETIYFSKIHLGTGFVHCAHGNIPVPAPATVEILKGVPVYSTGVNSELTTPTGACIVKTLSKGYSSLPEIEIEKIAYGLGTKDLPITNLLRVYLGKKN